MSNEQRFVEAVIKLQELTKRFDELEKKVDRLQIDLTDFRKRAGPVVARYTKIR